jgi:hypothetical protein
MLKKLTERQRRGRCTFGHSRRGTRTFKSTAPPSGVCSLGGAACALAPEILQRRFVCHRGVKVQLTNPQFFLDVRGEGSGPLSGRQAVEVFPLG